MTAIVVFVILGPTDKRASKACAPIALGLSLTLIHLVTIPTAST